MSFFKRCRFVLNTSGHNDQFSFIQFDCPIPKMDLDDSFYNQECFIFLFVVVPIKLSFEFREFDTL